MATWIGVTGDRHEVHPKDGTHFRAKELVKLLHGRDGTRLVCGPTVIAGVILYFLDIGPESLAGINTDAMLMLAVDWRTVYGDAIMGSDLELSCPEDHDWVERL